MTHFFYFHCVSEEFVENELMQLYPNKSTGLDGISPRFLRDGATVLKAPITHVINQSIQSGIVPDDLKTANVIPLFKKNNTTEACNYRPVSVLSSVSKILEKAVYCQLENFWKYFEKTWKVLSRNILQVIMAVMKHLANKELTNVQSPSSIKRMAYECNVLAKRQAAHVLSTSENSTLLYDGTSFKRSSCCTRLQQMMAFWWQVWIIYCPAM